MGDRCYKIAAFGDSITVGVRDVINEQQTYRQLLRQRLCDEGYCAEMINAGVGGSNTKDALGRMQRDVLQHSPDIVVVNFGMNDASMVDGPDSPRETPRVGENEFKHNLGEIVRQIQAAGSRVLLCTPTPMTDVYLYANLGGYAENDINYMLVQYARMVREIVQKYDTKLVDLFAHFTSDRALMDTVYDGCHPDADGQMAMAKHIYPTLVDMVKGISAE